MILLQDSLSAIPESPIAVVMIKTLGPTKASAELIANALSTRPSFNMKSAANISIDPDTILSDAILVTNLSSMMSLSTSFLSYSAHLSLCTDITF
ncbi:hypothetical protein D3C73_758820 [compost metagenome]